MKYFNLEVVTGDLILIKTNRPTPPPCPVLAQSAPHVDPMLVRLILWLCVWLKPIVCTRNRSKIAVLAILAGVVTSVILENLAISLIGT